MNLCPVVPLDLSAPYATILSPKSLADDTRRGCDWTAWLACNNPGATIDAADWAIHPDDDDTTLSLSQQTGTVITSVLISGGTLGSSYRLICTVTLSDLQSIAATVQITVRDVAKQAAIAA